MSLQRTVKSDMILFDVAAAFGVVGLKMDEEDARLAVQTWRKAKLQWRQFRPW